MAHIQENGKITSKMDVVKWYTRMVILTMEIGQEDNSVAKDNTQKNRTVFIKANFLMENIMAKVKCSTKMEINMKDNFKMVRNMEVESMTGKMVITMMEIGSLIQLRVMALP